MQFLFVDRIIQSSPGECIRGVKHITQEDTYLTIDEESKPYFMFSLIGEALGQLAAWNVMAQCDFAYRPVAGVVASARLYRPAYVGETLLLESFIDAIDSAAVQYHSIARVGQQLVFSIDGALGPMLPMTDFIERHEVEQQYKEIYRPGDWDKLVQLMGAGATEPVELDSVNIKSMAFDRIVHCSFGEYIVAEKKITRTASFFPDHFPKKPVLPMTILLEYIQHLARYFAVSYQSVPYKISELRKIKMNGFVQPGDVITCYMKVKQQTDSELVLACRNEVEGRRVCVVDIIMNAQGN